MIRKMTNGDLDQVKQRGEFVSPTTRDHRHRPREHQLQSGRPHYQQVKNKLKHQHLAIATFKILFLALSNISSIFSRFNKLRARHWPDYIDSDGQVAGRSSYSEDLQEGGRSAKSLRGEENAKKDDDVSVLLEDSDDEWIPGMLKN